MIYAYRSDKYCYFFFLIWLINHRNIENLNLSMKNKNILPEEKKRYLLTLSLTLTSSGKIYDKIAPKLVVK